MSLLSPLLAMLVALGAPDSGTERADAASAQAALTTGQDAFVPGQHALWPIGDETIGPVNRQVRIEQRVILRISPQPGNQRRDFLAELPRQAPPTRMVERPYGNCLKAGDIVGVADRGSRLLMYMRNRQIIWPELEEACSPRDFYLGFYVERSSDGMLCVDRDRLLSRAGAKCRISSLNRLVAVAE